MGKLNYDIRLRLNAGGAKCFGPGVAELLTLTGRHSSLRAAAMEMGMAYSKAWRIVKECEAAMGVKLLDSRTGGRNGGGASLTPEGERILQSYYQFCHEVAEAADRAFSSSFSFMA